MAGASSALCQAGQHPAVTQKGPYVTYNLSLTRFGRMFTDSSLAVGIAPHRTTPGHDRRAVGGRCRADGGEIR